MSILGDYQMQFWEVKLGNTEKEVRDCVKRKINSREGKTELPNWLPKRNGIEREDNTVVALEYLIH